MSRGISKLQRVILEVARELQHEDGIDRRVLYNEVSRRYALPKLIAKHRLTFGETCPSGEWQQPGVPESFRPSLSRAVKNLVQRGILKRDKEVVLLEAEPGFPRQVAHICLFKLSDNSRNYHLLKDQREPWN